MVAAREVVRDLTASEGGADAVVVVLLPDSGRSYLSKIYNDEWMRANGLLATTGAVVRVEDLLRDRHHAGPVPDLVLARTTQRGRRGDLDPPGVRDQPAPGLRAARRRRAIAGIVGSITEKGLLDRAFRDPSIVERTVGEVMDPPLPFIDVEASLDRALRAAVGRRLGGHRDPWRATDRRRHQARRPRVPRPPAGRAGLIPGRPHADGRPADPDAALRARLDVAPVHAAAGRARPRRRRGRDRRHRPGRDARPPWTTSCSSGSRTCRSIRRRSRGSAGRSS